MENMVEVRATFTGCNIKNKVVMQFELDGEYRGALPALSLMTGTPCMLRLSSDQQVLFVDKGTGEVIEPDENQTAIEYEEADADVVPDAPMLPAAEYEEIEDDGEDWDEYFENDAA